MHAFKGMAFWGMMRGNAVFGNAHIKACYIMVSCGIPIYPHMYIHEGPAQTKNSRNPNVYVAGRGIPDTMVFHG